MGLLPLIFQSPKTMIAFVDFFAGILCIALGIFSLYYINKYNDKRSFTVAFRGFVGGILLIIGGIMFIIGQVSVTDF